MIDEKFIELMNLKIDGVIDSAGERELTAFLERNPDGRRYYDDLCRTVDRIDAVESVAPPAEFHEMVVAAVSLGRPEPVAVAAREPGEGGGRFLSWLAAITFRPRLSYVSFFAVGLLFGAFIYAAISYNPDSRNEIDFSELYGTIGLTPDAASFHQTNFTAIEEDPVSGEIRFHQSDRTVLADVTLTTDRPVDWKVRFDVDELALAGFRRIAGTEGAVSVTPGELRVAHSGQNRYGLIFVTAGDDASQTNVTIQIYDGETLLYSESMAVTDYRE